MVSNRPEIRHGMDKPGISANSHQFAREGCEDVLEGLMRW